MASEEDHTAVYGEEDLDEDDDDDDESEEEDLILPTANTNITDNEPPQEDLDDDDVDDDEEDDTSSSNLAAGEPPLSSAVPNGDAATPTTPFLDPDRRQRMEDVTISAVVVEDKKPAAALDESRRLFQRLWTDEDEIELLQGFLDYTTTQRGGNNSSHHHDTTAFYEQIKCKLQLDFNKNQLVEKLRRLKKKYRNVLNKMGPGSVSGKEYYTFKSPHDQATFEISSKIWSGASGHGGALAGGGGVGGGGGEEGGLDDPNPNPNPFNSIVHINNTTTNNNNGIDANNSSDKKASRPRKRSRGVKIDEKHQFYQQSHPTATAAPPTATSIPNLIEETVRSCLSPLFKELVLLHNAMNGPFGSPRGFGGVAPLNPMMPLSFGSPSGFNFTGGDMNMNVMMDDKWRKQQILELEVYSKRLELVQDQIKSALEELRSMGS